MSDMELTIKEKLISVFLLKGDRINRTDFLFLSVTMLILPTVSLYLEKVLDDRFWSAANKEMVFETVEARVKFMKQNRFWETMVENISVPIFLIAGLFMISLISKRLHDLGRGGRLTWIVILGFLACVGGPLIGMAAFFAAYMLPIMFVGIPFVALAICFIALIILIYICTWPGQKGTNKYGEYFEIFPNPLRKIIGKRIKFFS